MQTSSANSEHKHLETERFSALDDSTPSLSITVNKFSDLH